MGYKGSMPVEALALSHGAAAVKAAFEVSKKVYDLVRSPNIDPTTIQEYLMQLQEHIINAQHSLGDATDENRELQEQLRQLNDDAEFDAELEYDGGVSWHKKNGRRDPFPCCPRCWSVLRKRVRLRVYEDYCDCPEDKQVYQSKEQRQQSAAGSLYNTGQTFDEL
jgi:hypothetical protein